VRRGHLVGRVRFAIRLGLPVLLVGALLDLVFAPDRLPQRLAGFGALAAFYVAILAVLRVRWLARRARTLAVVFTLGLATGTLYLSAQSPADLDVLTGPVGCVLIGSTLFFPWGAGAQAFVSGVAGAMYGVLFWSLSAPTGMRAVSVVITLSASVGLSVLGAFLLERSRSSTFAERRRVRALAIQRRHLLDIGRDLRTTLERDEILQRLLLHAERLIPTDGALLAVHDSAPGRYRMAAVGGDGRFQPLLGVEWAAAHATAVCGQFAPREVREVPGTGFDALVLGALAPFGVVRLLAAAVGPWPTPVAFVAWTRRTPVPFSRAERLAAQGIAEQAHTALAAAALYADARRASRIKSEFVSTMSHELRTPLNVIMGYNQILAETLAPDPEVGHALDAVRRAGVELLDLVESTLDLGRLEAGREAVHEETVRVLDLFEELGGEFAAVPRAPGVVLIWDPGDDPCLTADRRKLRTILKNLVGNALKFTPAGSVRVECRIAGERCRFRVADTGIGIDPRDQAAVFEMFRQGDSSDSRRYGGTGLGLYIVRRLVRLLGGEVGLESAPGRGSVFTVTVPVRGAGTQERSAA
jgi:signal transduction histidine kinase